MAKRTLLQLVQDTLSAIDGDEVNSISDTVESVQVVNIVKQAYFDMVDELDLPVNMDFVNLEGQANTAKPTHMRIPEAATGIEWIKYDVRLAVGDSKVYRTITRLSPLNFVEMVGMRDSTDTTNFQVVQYNANTPLVIGKLEGPMFWTSFDDEYVVFDSFDSAVDTTLQTSKCMAYGQLRPTFSETDAYVPDLPENLFSYLAAIAEARAFAQLKQQVNPKSEQREQRMRVRSQRNKWRQDRMNVESPDYGRK